MTDGLYQHLSTGCNVLPPMVDDRQYGRPAGRDAAAGRAADPKPTRKSRRRKTADRFGILNGFVDLTAKELSRGELLTWLTLFRDARDGIARTSQADIARRTGLGNRTVRYAVAALERRGLLRVVHRGGFRRGMSTYLVLAVDRK